MNLTIHVIDGNPHAKAIVGVILPRCSMSFDMADSPLWLASSSPRRADILSMIGIPFIKVSAAVDEDAILADTPGAPQIRAEAVARAKAYAVITDDDVFILAADTIVVVDDEILGKPRDRRHAFEMLNRIQNREHDVITAVCQRQPANHTTRVVSVISRVQVDALSKGDIDAYLALGEGMDAAGAYKIQGVFARHIRRINGDFWNVAGLSPNLVYRWWTEYRQVQMSNHHD